MNKIIVSQHLSGNLTGKQRTFKDFDTHFKPYALLAIVIIVGGIFGILLKNEFLVNENIILTNFSSDVLPSTKDIFTTFFKRSILILVAFLLGFSPISQPVLLFLPLIKGFSLGGFMAISMEDGISVWSLLPAVVVTSVSIILITKWSLSLSFRIYSTIFLEKKYKFFVNYIKEFTIKFIILELFLGIFIFCEALVIKI